jgi:hypothetical protein
MAVFYFGSFQLGDNVDAEDPLDAVWSYIERIASLDFLQSRGGKKQNALYASVRIRQAVEFRNASRATTLVTRPLPLYYSALNLARAGIAVVTGNQATPAHGLRHITSSDLLSNAAKVVPGTFPDLVGAVQSAVSLGNQLTLDDCLAALPELADQYSAIPGRISRAVGLNVRYESGLCLRFDPASLPSDIVFGSQWQLLFPKLADVCELGEDPTNELVVKRSLDTASYEAIGRFCSRHLEHRLSFGSTPLWYAIRQSPGQDVLPRAAYYLAGLFILSSVVRYQPELLVATDVVQSQPAWLLGRFLAAAERFLPQLLYSWIVGRDTYFGGIP